MALPEGFGSVVSVAQLADFLDGLDDRFATPSDIPAYTRYGLSISGHTVSLVEGGASSSVTVPDSDTTYQALTNTEIDNAVAAAFAS